MELFDSVNNTNDKESFITFLSILIDDYTKNIDQWENQDIGSF